MLVVPLGALVFSLAATFLSYRFGWRGENLAAALSSVATWFVLSVYWLVLWRSSVAWTRFRLYRTAWSAVFCAGLGVSFAYLMAPLWGFLLAAASGAGSSAFGWLGWTAIIWRQTDAEAEAIETAKVVCPTCGYNLCGLRTTTCPECGASPTLDQLLDGQPGQETKVLQNHANSADPV